jgi:hypothetical protein
MFQEIHETHISLQINLQLIQQPNWLRFAEEEKDGVATELTH